MPDSHARLYAKDGKTTVWLADREERIAVTGTDPHDRAVNLLKLVDEHGPIIYLSEHADLDRLAANVSGDDPGDV